MLSKERAQKLAREMKGFSRKDSTGHKFCDYCEYCYIWEGNTEHGCYFSQNQEHPIRTKKPCQNDELIKEYYKITGGKFYNE